jgi:hypothetical protein
MRVLLAITLILAPGCAYRAPQASGMISGVGKQITTVKFEGASYLVYEYESVSISGDLSIKEFRELLALTKPELHANEVIEAIVVEQYVPHQRFQKDSDFQVRTCERNCVKRFADRGASGRYLLFARTPEGLRLLRFLSFIE